MSDGTGFQKIDLFQLSLPSICMYCSKAGLFLNTDDRLESVVCLDYDNRKFVKKERPSNREARTYLKVMDSMETCDKWKPVNREDERCRILEKLGLIERN